MGGDGVWWGGVGGVGGVGWVSGVGWGGVGWGGVGWGGVGWGGGATHEASSHSATASTGGGGGMAVAASLRQQCAAASSHSAATASTTPFQPPLLGQDFTSVPSSPHDEGHDSQHDEGHEAAAGELWHEWGDEKLTDLHHSLNKGWFDRALWLLDKPETNVDTVVPWEYKVGGGNTALHFLAFKGGDKSLSRSLVHELATKLCSMSHLRLHQRNTRGLTALHVAASNGSDVVMRALLNARAGPFFKENHQKIYNSDDRSNFYILYRNKCW